MARSPRARAEGAIVHGLLLGNDRTACFAYGHWRRSSDVDHLARAKGTIQRRVLQPRGSDGAVLAFRRYRVDFPLSVLVPDSALWSASWLTQNTPRLTTSRRCGRTSSFSLRSR